MPNSILAQSRIQNEVFFEFEYGGQLLKHVNFKSKDFSPAANIGGTMNYRRPSKAQTFASAVASRGTVPTPGSAPSYGVYTEPKFPLVATRKFRQAVVISAEDASIALDTDQVLQRLKSRAVVLRHQVEQYAAGLMLAGSSSVIGTPGTRATGDTLLNNFVKASELINSRGIVDTGRRVALVPNVQVGPSVLQAMRGLYNPQQGIGKAFENGTSGLGRFGNINFLASPFIPTDTVTLTSGLTYTVTGAYQNAGPVWAQTWNLIITASGTGYASAVIPAGTLFGLTNSGTLINWTTADVFTDTGIQAFFRTTTDVTLSNGVGTLVCTEPLIAATTDGTTSTNGYQNVTANPANGAIMTPINGNLTSGNIPSLVFDPEAIAGVSIEVKTPRGVVNKVQEIDGVKLSLIETSDPLNLSTIYEIQAIVGFAVGMPEGVVSVY